MKIALCKKASIGDIPNKGYIFEKKEDGIRAVAVDGRLYNRDGDETGKNIFDKFPEIEVPENFALDGEIVNDKGVGSLTGRVNCETEKRIEWKAKINPARYRVFDLIMVGGTDYRKRPLMERKEALSHQERVRNAKGVEIVPYHENGHELLKKSKEKGWEGIVAKKKNMLYPEGRTANWLKIKNFDTEIFDVADYGTTEDGGFVIFVELGEGETQKIVVNTEEEQEKIRNADLENLKAEVRFLEKTDSGRLRHIAYEGLVRG